MPRDLQWQTSCLHCLYQPINASIHTVGCCCLCASCTISHFPCLIIPPISITPLPYALIMSTWSLLAVLGPKQLYALLLSSHYCFHPSCLPSVGRLHNVAWFWLWYITYFHYMPSICTVHEHMAISGCPGTCNGQMAAFIATIYP